MRGGGQEARNNNANNAKKPSLFSFLLAPFAGWREAAGGQYSSYLCLSAFICGYEFLYTCICMELCSEGRYSVATGSNNRIYTGCPS
jgi:hypothetical protein